MDEYANGGWCHQRANNCYKYAKVCTPPDGFEVATNEEKKLDSDEKREEKNTLPNEVLETAGNEIFTSSIDATLLFFTFPLFSIVKKNKNFLKKKKKSSIF